MISYSTLDAQRSRNPTCLTTPFPKVRRSSNPSDKVGDLLGDEVTRAIWTAVSDSSKWSLVCSAIAALCPGLRVDLRPQTGLAGRIYTSASVEEPGREVQQSTVFSELLVRNIDFGFDGFWCLHFFQISAGVKLDNIAMELARKYLPTIEEAAWMSSECAKAAIRVREEVYEQLGFAHSILDINGRLISKNAQFVRVFDQGNMNARRFKSRVADFYLLLSSISRKNQYLEFALHDEDRTCMVCLRYIPDSETRVSGTVLVGMECRGFDKADVPSAQILAQLFGLTQREVDIARLMATGRSVLSIANQHRVSTGTVRIQLKSIFRKMGVRSQIELVARVLANGFS